MGYVSLAEKKLMTGQLKNTYHLYCDCRKSHHSGDIIWTIPGPHFPQEKAKHPIVTREPQGVSNHITSGIVRC